MELTLKEARQLKSRLEKDIADVSQKRQSVSVVEIFPTDDFHDYINTTVEETTAQIKMLHELLFQLTTLIQQENHKQRQVGDKLVTLAALINQTIILRKEAKELHALSLNNPRSQNTYHDKNTVYVTTYDSKQIGQEASILARYCDQQSTLIDQLDLTIRLTLPETFDSYLKS